MDNPIEPVSRLRTRLKEECEKVGLNLVEFSLSPSNPQHPDIVQAMFTIDKDKVGKTEEQIEMDEKFREIALQERREQEQREIEEARRKLAEEWKKKKGGGFL